ARRFGAAQAGAQWHRHHIAAAAGGEDTPPGAGRRLQLLVQVVVLGLETFVLGGKIQDAFDTGEVDALLLGEPLHLAQHIHIPRRVSPSPAPGALRHHEAEAVVLAQGLRMHPRPFGSDRDQKDRGVVAGHAAHACAAAARWARGPVPSLASANCWSASAAALLTFRGTATSRVTMRSPVPFLVFTPRPLARSREPDCVPAGTLSLTCEPSSVGTLIVAPCTASGKVIGTVMVKF